MKEEFLYFIWKYKLYKGFTLFNLEANSFEIVKQGMQNNDAGPDFIDAAIKVSETTWAGNVEVHIKSSDWDIHKHYTDPAYNNVIIQVVAKHDKDVYTQDGRLVPIMELKISDDLKRKYVQFSNKSSHIACVGEISKIDKFKLKMWLSNVVIQRLNKKAELVEATLESNKNNWEETFYLLLAKSFGFNVNSVPFERLAKSLPLQILGKHKNSQLQIEALLFGQAGLLDDDFATDNYYNQLRKEYEFLKNKFGLIPIEKHCWKFLRLRPSNFPTIRIAQFAHLVCKSSSLFSKVVNIENLSKLFDYFECETSKYWETHYTFGKISNKKKKKLGLQATNLLIINTIIPVLFVYGNKIGDDNLKDRAIQYLEELKPECNKITKEWDEADVQIDSAFYSQALIEQKKTYCDKSLCLKCGIGVEILRKQQTQN